MRALSLKHGGAMTSRLGDRMPPVAGEARPGSLEHHAAQVLGPWNPKPPSPSRPQSARKPSRPQSATTSRTGCSGGRHPATTPTSLGLGRRVLPAELGLAGRRVLTLPSHVDTCDQGERCCWRWLAHAVLKEASWLKEDLDSVREEHSAYVGERAKVEHDIEAFAELRGAHAQLQREFHEVRADACELRRELSSIRIAHAHKAAREKELERDLARTEEERVRTAEREADAKRRADEAESLLTQARAEAEELKAKLRRMQGLEAETDIQLRELRTERDELLREKEEAELKRKKRASKRTGLSRSTAPTARIVGTTRTR
mmetsp:Transcript_124551/g.346791  ORF Transcript_124551/g.346791 Transcript_124551/m.346791 type:complete len:317 (-) Transcript_124551:81-1031(-)